MSTSGFHSATCFAAARSSVDRSIPLHLSRFFPRYRMTDKPPTPVERVYHLADTAREYSEDGAIHPSLPQKVQRNKSTVIQVWITLSQSPDVKVGGLPVLTLLCTGSMNSGGGYSVVEVQIIVDDLLPPCCGDGVENLQAGLQKILRPLHEGTTGVHMTANIVKKHLGALVDKELVTAERPLVLNVPPAAVQTIVPFQSELGDRGQPNGHFVCIFCFAHSILQIVCLVPGKGRPF